MDSRKTSFYERLIPDGTLLLAFIISVLSCPVSASAHDVGLSTAEVRCGPKDVVVEIVVAAKDLETLFELDADRDGTVAATELESSEGAIRSYAGLACLFRVNGGAVKPSQNAVSIAETNGIKLSLSFPAGEFKKATLRFDLITDLPTGHRMFVSIFDPAGIRLREELLGQNSPEIPIELTQLEGRTAASQLPSFLGFVKLGVEHIGTGYDHLLFLFALLLVTKNFRSAVAVISFFTLAHSVTLAVATFDLVNLPARITEPLIAATIVYVGLENIIRRGDPHGRWALTFCFGLVHGFGFASILRDMGVGGQAGGVAMPLLGFNLGVELGQLAVAAIVLPLIWKLRANPWFLSRLVPACSALVGLLGVYWLIERLWG